MVVRLEQLNASVGNLLLFPKQGKTTKGLAGNASNPYGTVCMACQPSENIGVGKGWQGLAKVGKGWQGLAGNLYLSANPGSPFPALGV